jgi:hypothetical protein
MKRFLQLLVALAGFTGGLWFFYAGYERQVSLAGRAEVGLTYLQTGVDGKTRVLTHHRDYAIGAVLLIGGMWWLLHGHQSRPRVKSRGGRQRK